MKKSRLIINLLFILALVGAALIVDWPNGVHWKIKDKKIIDSNYDIKRGLDLQGGARLTYSADLSKIEGADKTEALNSLANVMENRVNKFGVTEPVVQTSKVGEEYRVIVELPGVKDSNEAINAMGKVAELEFKELDESGQDFKSTGITGKDLKSAAADFDQNGNPQISLVFNEEGAKKFAEVTERNVSKPLATFLDGEMIQYANVNEKITGGNAVVTGIKDIKEAKTIAKLLNAGALPAPVRLIEQRTVGATLGQASIKSSIEAAIIGSVFVIAFILVSYKGLGIFATVGLALDLLLTLAIMKLFNITLTMGGVAGLILTIGMSMETDILVFERIREELRKGRSFESATNFGFKYTWPTIWDSNIVSFIISVILVIWSTGTVKGFAVVSILGIITGVVTTFIGTKTLMFLALKLKPIHSYWFFDIDKKEATVIKSQGGVL